MAIGILTIGTTSVCWDSQIKHHVFQGSFHRFPSGFWRHIDFLFQLVFLFSISRFFGTCVFVPTSGPAKSVATKKWECHFWRSSVREMFFGSSVFLRWSFPQVLGPGFASSSSWSRRPWQRCLFFIFFYCFRLSGWFGFDGRFSRIYTQNVIKAVKLGSSFGDHIHVFSLKMTPMNCVTKLSNSFIWELLIWVLPKLLVPPNHPF